MYILVFGDDYAGIDGEITKLKNAGFSNFFGDYYNLTSTLNSVSMFGGGKYVLNLDSGGIKFNNDLLNTLERYKDVNQSDIVFYTYSKVKIVKRVKDLFTETRNYNLVDNKEVFRFLDAVYSGNRKLSLSYINKFYTEDKNAMYIISMLLYSAKNLLYLYYDEKSFSRLHPYVQSKTKGYSRTFTERNIQFVVRALSQAELKIKSGGSTENILFSLVYYLSSL